MRKGTDRRCERDVNRVMSDLERLSLRKLVYERDGQPEWRDRIPKR